MPAKAKYNRISDNVIIGCAKVIDWLDGLSEKTVETERNQVVSDGSKVSLDLKTYEVSVPGFSKIPFQEIGLYEDNYRARRNGGTVFQLR